MDLFARFRKFIKRGFTVPRIIVFGFFIVAHISSMLLLLPFASVNEEGVSYIDALFTAVSAVCVTGLTVVNTAEHWSSFGKIVILLTIQIGGMGFMAFITMIFLFTGKKITLKERLVIQQSFNQNDLSGMVRLVKNAVFGTFLVEGVAALIMSVNFMFTEKKGFLTGLWYGVFHSVSAFCNAGFDILGEVSLSDYVKDPIINFVIMALIILGGLGYTVWIDVISAAKSLKGKKVTFAAVFDKLTVQSRIVIEVTFALITFGTLFYFFVEYSNPDTLGALPFYGKVIASLFQGVTPRTAGFFTLDQSKMHYSSQFMTVILMFVGGSPGSTAGGVKTITMYVIIVAVYSIVVGRSNIVSHNKKIPTNTLQKALAVVSVYLIIVFTAAMALTFTERGSVQTYEFMDFIFEVFSASSTVGLTLGITPNLTSLGKIIIMACMFLGRVGPITVAISLSTKQYAAENTINYPECKLIVG